MYKYLIEAKRWLLLWFLEYDIRSYYVIDRDKKEYDKCCENMEIVHNDIDVFINYGRVVGLGLSNEHTNFHENRYKIKRKSVYIRKYHIMNTITLIHKYNIYIP